MKNHHDCLICHRINHFHKEGHPYGICQLKKTHFFVGEHQFFQGYTVLYSSQHCREMVDLDQKDQQGILEDLMLASQVIMKIYRPHKMNYALLGNQVEHLHWHLFPRYEDDPHRKEHPWFNAHEFSRPQYQLNNQELEQMVNRIRQSVLDDGQL